MTAIEQVEAARNHKELFPVPAETEKHYRELAKQCHPDKYMGVDWPLQKRAHEAFAKLSSFYELATGKAKPTEVKIGKWIVEAPFEKGDHCDLHLLKHDPPAILKIARDAKDNDLLEREAKHLKLLHGDKNTANFKKYLPALYGTLTASGRRANVLSQAEGYMSLDQIRTQFHDGIEFRHVVWFMNRLLSCLGFIHRSGIIHGAVVPEHLLYHPDGHGMILVDWCYSVQFDSSEHIPCMITNRKSFYPWEVKKKTAYPSTDIYMAANSMKFAAKTIPDRFKNFFKWCTAESPKVRPEDAWELQDLWVKLAEDQFGKPEYVRLELPTQ